MIIRESLLYRSLRKLVAKSAGGGAGGRAGQGTAGRVQIQARRQGAAGDRIAVGGQTTARRGAAGIRTADSGRGAQRGQRDHRADLQVQCQGA